VCCYMHLNFNIHFTYIEHGNNNMKISTIMVKYLAKPSLHRCKQFYDCWQQTRHEMMANKLFRTQSSTFHGRSIAFSIYKLKWSSMGSSLPRTYASSQILTLVRNNSNTLLDRVHKPFASCRIGTINLVEIKITHVLMIYMCSSFKRG
jgi:hypothetical protein